jgi:hypothetical protein
MSDVPEHLRGDTPCEDCGGDNIKWFTLNVVWNEVREAQERFGSEAASIVCPTCFVVRADAAGYDVRSWLLLPTWASGLPVREEPA